MVFMDSKDPKNFNQLVAGTRGASKVSSDTEERERYPGVAKGKNVPSGKKGREKG